MADEKPIEEESQELEQETAAETPEENEAPAPSIAEKQISLKLVVMLFVGFTVVIGASVGLTLFLVGGDDTGTEVAKEVVEPEPPKEEVAKKEEPPAEPAKIVVDAEPGEPPSYIEMGKPFVVNFSASESGQSVDHLMLEAALVFRGPDHYSTLHKHMPLIRNQLQLYFGSEQDPDVKIEELRQSLKDGALKEVNKILKQELGHELIEEVLFISFVMQ